jgi:hypothetical protein
MRRILSLHPLMERQSNQCSALGSLGRPRKSPFNPQRGPWTLDRDPDAVYLDRIGRQP